MAISSTTFRSLRSSGSVVLGSTSRPPSIVATALPPWASSRVLKPLPRAMTAKRAHGSAEEELRIPERQLWCLLVGIHDGAAPTPVKITSAAA